MQKQHVDGCNEANHGEKAEEHRDLALSQEDLSLRSKEVLHSMQHVSRLSEKKKDAESEIAPLLSPPQVASTEAKELALQVEESNAKEMAHKLKLQPLERQHPCDLDDEASRRQVSSDLGDAKEESRRLRIDVPSASALKAEAEKEVEDSSAKADKFSRLIEDIKEEIATSIAEEALANAAQVEADEGFRYVEAQGEAEAARFSKSFEERDIRKNNLHKDIDHVMKLQMQLETTASDIDALQNEIKVIRAMDKNLHTRSSTDGRTEKEMLQSAKDELARAKKDLQSLKEEGFKLMSEMDDIRRELQQIADQKEKSSRIKYNSDSILQHLIHKLRNSRSKLEAASSSEKRAEAIVSNISAALQQLHVDIEAAKIDTQVTCEAIEAARMEIEKTKHNVLSMEQRLQRAMRELKEGILFEDLALKKLRTVSESTTGGRALSSLYNSMTISNFEYYYLIKQAKTAQEIASKKVAAAQAWIDAPTAEAAHQRRLSILRKGHVYVPKRSMKTKVNAHDLNFKLAIAMPRRSVTLHRVSGTYRRTKSRRASMSSGRQPPTVISSKTCLAGSTRKNIMLKIVRFLGRGNESEKQP